MLTLQALAKVIGAQYVGADVDFNGASIDTRTLKSEQLYIAIKGEQFDGHQFIQQAIDQGANAVLVSRAQPDIAVPQVVVADTVKALGALAKAWRLQFTIPVVAITGSCGKTTTKEMLASILKQRGEVLYTQGNYNNHIGVPLTLLQLKSQHQFAVLEIGMNHPGEIEYLTQLVKPTVAVVTNIRPVHIEAFDSIDAIAVEKAMVYQGLSQESIAIINNDEPYANEWRQLIDRRHSVSFAMHHPADVTAIHCHYGDEGLFCDFNTPLGQQAVAVPLLGEGYTANALAATAAAMAVGATRRDVAAGLAAVKPVPGRLYPHPLSNNVLLVDDTYNNNPFGAEVAIQFLKNCPGKKIFVTTHMTEVGKQSEALHQQVGECLKANPLDAVFLVGDQQALQPLIKAYPQAQYYPDKTEVIAALKPIIQSGDVTIVVKGAHAMAMDSVVQALL